MNKSTKLAVACERCKCVYSTELTNRRADLDRGLISRDHDTKETCVQYIDQELGRIQAVKAELGMAEEILTKRRQELTGLDISRNPASKLILLH